MPLSNNGTHVSQLVYNAADWAIAPAGVKVSYYAQQHTETGLSFLSAALHYIIIFMHNAHDVPAHFVRDESVFFKKTAQRPFSNERVV